MESIDLGDPRRNRRAIRLIERLSAKPTASIPQACGDWADTLAAYRFFGNEEIEWPDILAPHIESSVNRMAAHEVARVHPGHHRTRFQRARGQRLGALELRGPTQLPTTQLVYLADREADIMALMVRARSGHTAGLVAARPT